MKFFGLSFGAATQLISAFYLRAFGAHNLGKARCIASPIVSPLQPIGVLNNKHSYRLSRYLFCSF